MKLRLIFVIVSLIAGVAALAAAFLGKAGIFAACLAVALICRILGGRVYSREDREAPRP